MSAPREHAPYDPVKAHEYYMRNRKLHPRRRMAAVGTPKTTGGPKGRPRGGYTVKTQTGTYHLSQKQLDEQKAYCSRRIAQIKVRLSKLRTHYREMLRKAKESERNSKKPETAAEKAKSAREAEKYRKKHKTELASKAAQKTAKSGGSSTKKSDTVASVREDIAKAKTSLKDAVARQRALASATKNG